MTLIVYHGTSTHALPDLLAKGPDLRRYNHVKKPAFCTTKAFGTAADFALRRTSSADFIRRVDTRAIVEYELTGTSRDFKECKDTAASLVDEDEVAVFRPACLAVVAVWRPDARGKWIRHLTTAESVVS